MDNTLSTLPNEIISRIVNHVDQPSLHALAQTNTKFYTEANAKLWKTVDLHQQQQQQQEQQQERAMCFLYRLVTTKDPLGEHIRHVNLEGFEWTDPLLLLLMRKTPWMTSAVFDHAANITDDSIKYISLYWPHLKSLRLTGSPISQESFHELGQECRQLTRLELYSCSGLQSNTFAVHFAGSLLEVLVLDIWVNQLEEDDDDGDDGDDDDDDDDDGVWVVAPFDVTGLHCLTHLQVHGGPPIGILPPHSSPSGSSWWWPRLTFLYLDECFDMRNIDVIPLLRSTPGLKYLTLKDSQFTDLALDAIATYQPGLVELNIAYNDHVTHYGIRSLIHRCRRLVLVTLTYCGITVAQFPEAASHCHGRVVTMNNNTVTRLDHLDKHALDTIRSGR